LQVDEIAGEITILSRCYALSSGVLHLSSRRNTTT
jgi:hypothetical protein